MLSLLLPLSCSEGTHLGLADSILWRSIDTIARCLQPATIRGCGQGERAVASVAVGLHPFPSYSVTSVGFACLKTAQGSACSFALHMIAIQVRQSSLSDSTESHQQHCQCHDNNTCIVYTNDVHLHMLCL